MNRREMITSAMGAAFAAQAATAQQITSATFVSPLAAPQETNIYGSSPRQPTPEEKAQQYGVCQERGHTPTQWGNMHGFTATNAVFVAVQDRAASPYPNVGAGEWQTCWYCKTRYRFVTTMEEEGKP